MPTRAIGGTLALFENYNGLGYFFKGVPSPYIWSGTTAYKAGKYIADHVYSATTVDAQLGCAGLLLAMMGLDDTIRFGTDTGLTVKPVTAAPFVVKAIAPPPSLTHPAAGSLGAGLAGVFSRIFH